MDFGQVIDLSGLLLLLSQAQLRAGDFGGKFILLAEDPNQPSQVLG